MGELDDEGGRTVREVPESEEAVAPERDAAPRRALPTPSSAWGPSGRAGRALVGRPDVGDAPDGAPTPALLPADPDDVEVALLGDADHAPPRRTRAPAPVLPAWARAEASPERVRRRLALASEHLQPPALPHLDPGGPLVDHLRRWRDAVAAETGLGPLLATAGAPPSSPHAAAAELLARGQLALLAQPDAPRRAASARLAAALGRMDDVELTVARSGTRVPRVVDLLPPGGSSTATSPADPAWIDWWRAALALPHGADLARAPTRPAAHPFDTLIDDPQRVDRTLRHGLALRGVELARAALRLRVRAVGAHAALLDGVGAEAASRARDAVQGLDPEVDELLAHLRALGRGLHRAPHWPEERAREALASVGATLDALVTSVSERLASATPLDAPPGSAPARAPDHPSLRAALHGDAGPLSRHPRPALAVLGRILQGLAPDAPTLPASGLVALATLRRADAADDPEPVLEEGLRRSAALGGGAALRLIARWAPTR